MARKNTKKSKKMSLSLLITLILITVGGVGGYFTLQKVTENDVFEITANKVVEIEVGQDYVDNLEEVKVISFGKDISDKVVVAENTINKNTPGQYYIKYAVDNFRFKGIERFRIIKVVEVEDEGV